MNNFLLYSVIGSVVLTVLLNVLPVIFPNAANNVQRKLEENAKKAIQQHEDDQQPDVKVFCLLYTSPSPRDQRGSRMPSSA